MSVGPVNNPAYNKALSDLQTFQSIVAGQSDNDPVSTAEAVLGDGARVYYDPNISQQAKDALHAAVQQVMAAFQAQAYNPSVSQVAQIFIDIDNVNYGDSKLSPS